ncbi:MAG: hypothetical protein LAO79_02880, partial [Acidobacteriia bacterium]|nr:hypothetical protein [Terriglobia bacterium]
MPRTGFTYFAAGIALVAQNVRAQGHTATAVQQPFFFEQVQTAAPTYVARSREFSIELSPRSIIIERNADLPER